MSISPVALAPYEAFYVDLFGNSGNALLLDGRSVGTIVNDD